MDALLSPRRRTLLQALAGASLLAACGERRGVSAVPAFEFRGPAMGSTYTLKVAGRGVTEVVATAAHDAVHAALGTVERAMSAYLPDSELSRFNRHPAGTPFALSSGTFAVFALAQRISAATGGAFDITVAPLVDAWGFGPGRGHRVVGADEAAALRATVGHARLALDPALRTATKAHAALRADLSGIAKGYGVDQAARGLEALGVGNYMVEAGGEVATAGANAEGRPWRIAIEKPDAVPQRPWYVVPLSGQAMATSGDYRIYFERDGRRYCHEIDPATGAPVPPGLASVTVVAADCATADALATGLMVLGGERGHALAVEQGIAACFIARSPAGLTTTTTPAFDRLGGSPLA